MKFVHIWVTPSDMSKYIELGKKITELGMNSVSHNSNYFRAATQCDFYVSDIEFIKEAYEKAGVPAYPQADKKVEPKKTAPAKPKEEKVAEEKEEVTDKAEEVKKAPAKKRGRPSAKKD